jgi:hypothetical protein
MRLRSLYVVVMLLSAAAPAWGGPRDHRDGFFLRLSGGLGHAESSLDDVPGSIDQIDVSGTSGDLNIAIGGVVSRNLALHGTLWGWSVGGSDVEVDGVDIWNDATFTLSAVGIGVTYYFMPINIYISPSLGLGVVNLDVPGPDYESDTGLAFDFTLGKEWWVSRGWGLGIAGGLGFHSIDAENSNDEWSGTSFGVRFTATFN